MTSSPNPSIICIWAPPKDSDTTALFSRLMTRYSIRVQSADVSMNGIVVRLLRRRFERASFADSLMPVRLSGTSWSAPG